MALCRGCREELNPMDGACRRCAAALPNDGVCATCQRRPPPFAAAWSAMPFNALSRGLVHQLKYHGQLASASVLGQLLHRRLQRREGAWPEVLVPVPLHPRRARERGFNQAAEITRVLSRAIAVPMDVSLCRRRRDTPPQALTTNVEERHHNLKRAFEVRGEMAGISAAIIDDVVTSGATVGELARELKRARAGRLEVWSVCRAEPHSPVL